MFKEEAMLFVAKRRFKTNVMRRASSRTSTASNAAVGAAFFFRVTSAARSRSSSRHGVVRRFLLSGLDGQSVRGAVITTGAFADLKPGAALARGAYGRVHRVEPRGGRRGVLPSLARAHAHRHGQRQVGKPRLQHRERAR